MNWKQFQVGDVVLVHGSVSAVYDDSYTNRILRKESVEEVRAVIAGGGRLQLGSIQKGGAVYSQFDEPDHEPNSLVVSQVVSYWRVLTGLLNKPLKCLPEQLEFLSPANQSGFKLPILKQDHPEFTEDFRKMLSEDAKAAKRDGNGRFVRKDRL